MEKVPGGCKNFHKEQAIKLDIFYIFHMLMCRTCNEYEFVELVLSVSYFLRHCRDRCLFVLYLSFPYLGKCDRSCNHNYSLGRLRFLNISVSYDISGSFQFLPSQCMQSIFIFDFQKLLIR